ncbi:MAG: sporulation protein YqfD [Clostridiales bacterium]|nr:sporulation protein YqfD [Clostridiales bacterium]
MRRAINWLRGTVTLEVWGPFLERFFNICAAAGLGLWDVETQEEHRARVTLALWDLRRAGKLAEKAGCETKEVGRGGLPALILSCRRRYGMAAGLIALTLLFGVLSRVVLVVEVEGNETVSTWEILAQLQSEGFGVGSYGPGVDVRALSNRMLMEMEELSLLTVNISGIRATVIVREADPVPEVADERAADLAAAQDGVIVRLDVTEGRTVVEEGQAVLAGEVLVSGLLTHELGDGSGTVWATQQVRAAGEVWALTRRTLSAATPLEALVLDENGAVTEGWAVEILGNRLNFYGNSSNLDERCDKITMQYPLTLSDGTALPFGVWKTTWQSWSDEPGAIDPDWAEGLLRESLTERLEALVGEGEVLSTQWEVTATDGAMTVTLTAQCLENIARTVVLEE